MNARESIERSNTDADDIVIKVNRIKNETNAAKYPPNENRLIIIHTSNTRAYQEYTKINLKSFGL